MSADNYLYVAKLPGGFAVYDRFASGYYADEGATVEDIAHLGGDETWIIRDPKPWRTFDTAQEALNFAWDEAAKRYYEYGVSVAADVSLSLADIAVGDSADKPRGEL